MRSSPIATTHATAASIFVGFNAGEWGGGAQRIDRKTGEVVTIERIASAQLCAGPLNPKCDPVNGVATEPWKNERVVMTVGLIHFFPKGRIIEVCGDEVRRLYFKPFDFKLNGRSMNAISGRDEELPSTVAFYGLTQRDNALWAVAMDGIYKFGPEGLLQTIQMPEFKQIGGLKVSFDVPGFVLVLTQINARRSVGGLVPLLVLR